MQPTENEIVASKWDPYSNDWHFMVLEDLANIVFKWYNIDQEKKISITRDALLKYWEPLPIGYTTPNGYTVENIMLPADYSEKVWHYTFVKWRYEHTHQPESYLATVE